MPLLTALLTMVSKQLGTLLRAVLGWSVSALFGRLSDTRAAIMSGMLIASLAWPILVLGIFFPAVSAWVFAMVPLQKWVGPTVVRVGSIVLAVIVPAIIGVTVHALADHKPDEGREKPSVIRTIVGGYPLTIGLALACLITVIIVPLVKIGTMARGWTDAHVYVQPKKGRYEASLGELARACAAAGMSVEAEPVPASMDAATRVLKFFARGTVEPLIAADPKRLKNDELELYLYPADLLIRGKEQNVARVRARMVNTRLERDAFLVAEHDAQVIEGEMGRLAAALDDGEAGHGERDMVKRLRALLDERALPFEEWVLLDRSLRQLEIEVSGALARGDDPPSQHSVSGWH